jgi:hypothetical protein
LPVSRDSSEMLGNYKGLNLTKVLVVRNSSEVL